MFDIALLSYDLLRALRRFGVETVTVFAFGITYHQVRVHNDRPIGDLRRKRCWIAREVSV